MPPENDSPSESPEPNLNPEETRLFEEFLKNISAQNLFSTPPGTQGIQATPKESTFQNTIDSLLQKLTEQQKRIEEQQEKINAQQKVTDEQQKKINSQQGIIDDLKDRTEAAVNELRDTRNLVFLGFIVVVIMVCGMTWTATNERINKYDSMVEKVYSYQDKIDSLQTQIQLQERSVASQPLAIAKRK